MKLLAPLPADVWIGNREACDAAAFDQIVHLYRRRDWPDRTCEAIRLCTGHGLRVRWREEEPIAAMQPDFGAFLDYVRQPGKLLVHCSAGLCRSAHLALAAMIARGVAPLDAVAALYAGLWTGYAERHVPLLDGGKVHDLFQRLELSA